MGAVRWQVVNLLVRVRRTIGVPLCAEPIPAISRGHALSLRLGVTPHDPGLFAASV